MQSDKSSHDRKVRRKQSTPSSSSSSLNSSSSSKKESTSSKKEMRTSTKSSTNNSLNSSSIKSNETTVNVMNVTLTAIDHEEKEALSRDPEQDVETFNHTCDEIRTKLAEMKICKKDNNTENDPDFNKRKLEIAMAFLELKRLNRFDKIRCKHARDLVTEEKQKVDGFHLQLQNLMYEVLHLQKEINKCHEFKSRDETIELVSLEQFYEEAPEDVTKPLKESEDAHKRTLARLEWELEQRKRLASTLQDKMALKELIVEDIEKEKKRLESLRPILMSVVEAAQPLQSQLGLPLQVNDNQHEKASYLSRPMYVLFVNACAMKEAYKENFAVSINGNVDEAKATQFSNIIEDEESAESDAEDRKGKRHRKSKMDKKELMMKKLISAHPLSVNLNFADKESGTKLSLEFFHMINLNIITVKVNITGEYDISRSELLGSHILDNLFEKDDGLTSPNIANDYQLKAARIDNFSDLSNKIGYAYKWAQTLCGLNFLPRDEDKQSVSYNFTQIMDIIKSRFTHRTGLHQIILELERGSVSLPSSLVSVAFNKMSCLIKDWKPSSLDEWLTVTTGQNMFDFSLIDGSEHFFKVTLVRGSASLKALVALPTDYPNSSPLFQLTLNWQSEKTSSMDTSLRDLEYYVNIKCIESVLESEKIRTLAIQIYTLCVGFDTFLEAEQNHSGAEGPMEFPKGRIFSHNYSGRDHSKPFEYAHEYGIFR
ncbi:THO complex subunit 5 homolog B [Tetranychus urticae]|uniref:THO complex subunit 5 homolog n=1 Tax=Tetranychus urticae TaxID=32264 RepID=T1KUU3_TETUR|nr:THO complex subunit 5 homolog B [Tetranychus urticae]